MALMSFFNSKGHLNEESQITWRHFRGQTCKVGMPDARALQPLGYPIPSTAVSEHDYVWCRQRMACLLIEPGDITWVSRRLSVSESVELCQ